MVRVKSRDAPSVPHRVLGCETEGVFRKAASARSVSTAKHQLESGQFNPMECSDAHVPACLMKRWFMELSEGVIPASS